MKPESIIFAVAGMVFGLIVGWMIGDQQARRAQSAVAAPVQQSSAPSGGETRQPQAVDESRVQALTTIVQNDAKNADARIQLGNLYFDAERFQDAIAWYEEALRLEPNNVDVSTDLGVSYYYTNQPDRALKQFDDSLRIAPTHAKTLLNQGIVRAFAKRDLAGAQASWEKVVQVSPNSPEAKAAQQALDSLKAAHTAAGGTPPGS